MSIRLNQIMLSVILFCALILSPKTARALDLEQMKKLPGTDLLGLRVDAAFQHCGLPTTIVDSSQKKQQIRWGNTLMTLSAMDWDLSYARAHISQIRKPDWTNPAPVNNKCLSSLSRLELHAKGNSGILSVNKRADNKGYTTTYRIPDNIYAAHLIVNITGYWKTSISTSQLHERYGAADEIINGNNGLPFHRYWVISKNDKQMPVFVYAVDFEVGDNGKTVKKYLISTSDADFVQQKLDVLMRKWEKDYVLD